MQIFAIVVSLAIAAVGITLFVKAIRTIIASLKIGQPAVGRSDDKAARWTNMLKETLGHTRMLQWTAVGIGHWFVFIGFGLLFLTLLTAFGQLFDAHFALPLIGHFFLYEWVSRVLHLSMLVAIVAFIGYRASRPRERTRGTKGRFYGSTMWQGVLRRGGHPRRRALHRGAARRRVRHRAVRRRPGLRAALPVQLPRRRGALGAVASPPWPPDLPGRDAQDRHLVHLDDRDLAEHHDGRRLAPVHRVLQHLVQARVRRRHRPRRPPADDGRRRPDRLREHRGARRGHPPRRRQDRGLRLEGHPGLHLVHRVRPLPVPVPRLEHREAAVPQAADHRTAGPRATPRRRTCWRPRRATGRRCWRATTP